MKASDIAAGTTYVQYTTGKTVHVLSTEQHQQARRHGEGTNTIRPIDRYRSSQFRYGVLALELAPWQQNPANPDSFFAAVAADFDIDGFLKADPDTGEYSQPGEFVVPWGGHARIVRTVVVQPGTLERSYADEKALRAKRGEEHKQRNLAEAAAAAERLAQATADFEELTALVGADAAETLGYWQLGEIRDVPISTIAALVEAGIRRATGGSGEVKTADIRAGSSESSRLNSTGFWLPSTAHS